MKFRHTFPADGEYRFTIPDLGMDLYTRVVETRHTLVILVDGREVFRESLGGPDDMRTVDRGGAPGRAKVMERFANIPVQVKAGAHDVAVTFIERARIESDEFVGFLPGDEFSRGDRMPRLVDGVKVVGPFNSPGVSETPAGGESSCAAPARPDRGTAVCPPHRREPRPSRVSPAGDGGRDRFADAVFRAAAERNRADLTRASSR